MRSRPILAAAAAALLAAAACGGPSKPAPEKPVKPVVTQPPAPAPAPAQPKTVAERFVAECKGEIAAARAVLPAIRAATGPRTLDNTLRPLDDLFIHLGNAMAMAGLFSEVHPDEAVREGARACEQEGAQLATELSLDRPLYDAIAAVPAAGLDDEARRFVELKLRDFRIAGVDKDEATRARLTEINEELTKLAQQFAKNISEDVRAIDVPPARLEGLPDDFIAAHEVAADGTIHITTDYPDYMPVMMYADDDAVRKELYVKFRSRGAGEGDRDNNRILLQVLTLRAEMAKLLGFANFADYITQDKMIGSGTKAAAFIERVTKLASTRAKKDYDELLKELKTIDKKATRVEDWQKTYLENRVKLKKYKVDSKEIRPYFPFAQTLQGLLDITSAIYDIQYVPSDVKPWHEDVKVYDVMRGSEKLGRVYLDMHPRENKYKHAAQFALKDGVIDKQLPEGVLVCNFAKGDELMEHDDVVTMFHEFGHLMHHVLGGHHEFIRQTGVATEQDFVEAPSQMFEEWAWNHETLKRFAKNAAGDIIPKDLVDRMRKADTFGLGTQTVQQMFYAAISLRFHTADPATLEPLALVKELQKKYTPFAYVDGTAFHTSFGHLMGYSAVYYTYMWSLVIAKDLLTPFEKTGLMDTRTTYAYRDKILVPGGAKDAAVLVHDFLGRDYDFKAFERYLSR
jgi:thimet oligopeptidase